MAVFAQNADGSWSQAEPMGWQEEHSLIQRLIFWIRGVPHCCDNEETDPRG